ncbi:hypothetical protein ACUSIJ_10150 [Pseudochelatococcus sp. B33]
MTAQTAGTQTPQAPWSVKGIAPHTREAVKEAARRSGMTIGEWLSSAITRQAEAEPAPAHAAAADARWAEVAAHLARLVRRDADVAPSPPPGHEVSVHAIERWLREAEARAVRREQIRAARLAEALTGLARYIDNAERARAEEARRAALEHAEAVQELSHTLARIARRVKRIDDRLADLPREAAVAAQAAAGQTTAAQAELLASHLLPAMEQRLAASLGEIIESLSPAGHDEAPPPQPAMPDAEQLAVEDRLARAIVDIRARQIELARLEAEDDGDGQQAIIERLEALSRKLDSALRPNGDDAQLGALDTVLERLDSISSRLDDNRPAPALSRIEAMVRNLSENVEALHRDGARADAPTGEAALDTLAAQISQLAQRLEDLSRHDAENGPDADPENRSRLQNLETAIGVLSLQLRDLPRADEATLERVARAAAREALGALSLDDTLPRARSEDTLDAVHSTLERIVDRLALIEEDIRASGIGLQQPADAPPGGGPAGDPLPQGSFSLPEIRAAQALSRVFSSPASDDAPAPIADEPENLLARDSGGLTENVGFTASFIAAARRAAMAAADETRHKPAASPAAETSPDAASRRRSLLIGLGALIAATGAAQVAATLMHGAARLS